MKLFTFVLLTVMGMIGQTANPHDIPKEKIDEINKCLDRAPKRPLTLDEGGIIAEWCIEQLDPELVKMEGVPRIDASQLPEGYMMPDGQTVPATAPSGVIMLPPDPYEGDCFKLAMTTTGEFEPIDVPAVQETVTIHPDAINRPCRAQEFTSSGLCFDWPLPHKDKAWTCADKFRALETSVDGKLHWCHRMQE